MVKSRFKTRLSKKQKWKNILFFLIGFVFIYAFSLFFNIFIIGGMEFIFEAPAIEAFAMMSVMAFYILALLGMPFIPVIGLALGVQKGKAKRLCDISTPISVRGIEYYRGNLSELNPSLVSLLIDLDIYGKKGMMATLLRMRNKKIIEFSKKGGIIVLEHYIENMEDCERELLNMIKNRKLADKNYLSLWKRNRFCEAERLGYIKKKAEIQKIKYVKGVLLSLLSWGIGMLLWWGIIFLNILDDLDTVSGIVIVAIYSLLIIIFLFMPGYFWGRYRSYNQRTDVYVGENISWQ